MGGCMADAFNLVVDSLTGMRGALYSFMEIMINAY